MASLRIYLREEFRWRYTLLDREVRIGRNRDNHIVLPHPEVSRYQARIEKDSRGYRAFSQNAHDLDINERPSEGSLLKDGDILQMGIYRLVFEAEDPVDAPTTITWESTLDLQPSGTALTPRGKYDLVVLEGPEKGKRLSISEGLVKVGRHPEADLSLSDKAVSKSHLEIELGTTGLHLRDVGSTNGTYVDGQKVQSLVLQVGSEIQIGQTILKVFIEEGLAPAALPALGRLIGRSDKMEAVYQLIRKGARQDISIVIQGETGTGKELVAKEIHRLSPRAKGPFLTVDCGTIPKNLIESELFGHEKGAFTGAATQRKGAFELANGGTIFLDEIGELPLDMQPKLLRVLEEKHFKRIGGSEHLQSDFRVIAASNRSLDEEVRAGRFRRDLLFRLYILPIPLPPLRERKEDIPLLVEYFLQGKEVLVPPSVLEKLKTYPWPGNVRELRNVMERGLVVMEGSMLQESDLLFLKGALEQAQQKLSAWNAENTLRQPRSLEAAEKQVICRALESAQGDKRRAASVLGIALSTLYDKIKRYSLDGKGPQKRPS